MPHITFPSIFLKAKIDVNTGDTIKFFDAGEQDEKDNWIFTVLIANGEKKKFQLNKTNWKAISKVYGTNSDEWVNKEFDVTIIKTQNPQGDLVDGIRLTVSGKNEEGEEAFG